METIKIEYHDMELLVTGEYICGSPYPGITGEYDDSDFDIKSITENNVDITQLFSDGDFDDIREIVIYAYEEKMIAEKYSDVEKQEDTIEDKWNKLFRPSNTTKAGTLFGNLTDCEKRQVLQGDWDIYPPTAQEVYEKATKQKAYLTDAITHAEATAEYVQWLEDQYTQLCESLGQ